MRLRSATSASWSMRGSTDETVQIAQGKGARVVSHPFEGFGAQKGFALSLATGDWVLSIDADERVLPELAQEILHAVGAGTADCYEIAIVALAGWPRLIVLLPFSAGEPEPRLRSVQLETVLSPGRSTATSSLATPPQARRVRYHGSWHRPEPGLFARWLSPRVPTPGPTDPRLFDVLISQADGGDPAMVSAVPMAMPTAVDWTPDGNALLVDDADGRLFRYSIYGSPRRLLVDGVHLDAARHGRRSAPHPV